uniref:Protein kinase domain-containing protein n=1 Tax=Monopterus albus TaxID=43700 RepID=A0A3Q3K4C7_MONAL
MSQAKSRSSAKRLLELVERYNLYHVKTLRYSDTRGVLEWLGVTFTFEQGKDTVAVLDELIRLRKLRNIAVAGIDEEPRIQGKDRLVVHIKRQRRPASRSCKYDSVVLFLVIPYDGMKAPYSQELTKVIKKDILRSVHAPLFPTFASCPAQHVEPHAQQAQPVLDGFLPSSYDTTKPRTPIVNVDNFGRKYVPLKCTACAAPWSIYADLAVPRESKCEFDIEELINTPNKVLGRGGFGVTVQISDRLVAKTNLFPEMVNWSVPFIDDEFNRYAHIASQAEEVMIGVSMKHPNILRTFGGFWCDVPGYQLGGRVVLLMERALFSLKEFMWHMRSAVVMPAIELDTLRGLDYLRSRAIQHRDFTYRNVLVCHQPDRKPIPFAFKISDFGTACNFSTPDHMRGNRTNMAPEVLWCLNAATGSDICSWYCVMWELHSGSPLVPYKGSERGYCKKTHAANLSNLVGVYNPEKDETFELDYMKAMDARALHAKHKDRRPTVQTILATLCHAGCNITDNPKSPLLYRYSRAWASLPQTLNEIGVCVLV